MRSRHILEAGVVVVVLLAAGAAYAPDRVATLAPPVGPLAHRIHDLLASASPRADSSTPAAGPPVIRVSVVSVQRADMPETLIGLGQVQAENSVTLRTRVDGAIDRIGFVEGDNVKAGDVIAQIDPRPYQAALDQATAKKAQDEANLINARLDLERYATLVKKDYATRQQFDTQQALVNQLIASEAADAAAIDAARLQLDYATIRAPISGRAGLRLIDAGNLVSAAQQTAIVTLAQIEPIAAVFTAPQNELGRITKAMAGDPPSVEVDTADGAKLAVGKLVVIDNQVDPTTATFKLKAEFANADHALWPGLAVTTQTTIGVDRNALTIPAAAVQRGAKGLFVYVLGANGRAELRNVKIARQTPEVAVVASGLAAGESVIIDNIFLLQDQTPVRVDSPATGS